MWPNHQQPKAGNQLLYIPFLGGGVVYGKVNTVVQSVWYPYLRVVWNFGPRVVPQYGYQVVRRCGNQVVRRVVGPRVGCRVHLVTHHVCGSVAGSHNDRFSSSIHCQIHWISNVKNIKEWKFSLWWLVCKIIALSFTKPRVTNDGASMFWRCVLPAMNKTFQNMHETSNSYYYPLTD